MKCLLQAHTVAGGAEMQLLKTALEEGNVPCTIRNESLGIAMGEIPFAECFPELWILDDSDYPKAAEIISDWRASKTAIEAPWVCPNCGESIEGQFTSCWKCGTERG